MGIELPPELADVAAQTGVQWPEADEDKMRETAQAWRDTGTKITALISDADGTARSALATTEGESADAARKHWGTYVQPDTGKLTSMARGCTKAADQLDHAATQVADAKLAIVQNLVPLAKNKDVAEHAAASGHPTALLGLDTAIKGTAANIANVHSTLVTAVQPAAGMTVDAVQPIANPNPGAHPQSLLSGLAQPSADAPGGPPGDHGKGLLSGAAQPVADLAQSATGGHTGAGQGLLQPVADLAKPVTDTVTGGHGGQAGAGHGLLQPVADLAKPVTDTVTGGHGGGGQGLLQPVADLAKPVVDGVAGSGDHGKGVVPGIVQPVADGVVGSGDHGQRPGVVPGLVDGVTGGPGGHGGHGGVVPGVVAPVVDAVGGGHGQHPGAGIGFPGGAEPVTGPIPVQDRPHVLPVDAPTPPAGFQRPDHVVQAASAAVLDSPPAQAQPAQPAPVNQPVAPPAPAGGGGGGFVSGGPAAPPSPMAPPPAGAAPPPSVGAQPGQQPTAAPPAQRGPAPMVMAAEPVRQAPAAIGQPAAYGKPEERETVIAIWLVRMFPIGHMPIAADRPSRQLPPPSPEFDYAAGMRFEPNDHPESARIDDGEALAWAREGGDAVKSGEPQEHELTDGHDPLAGQNERDWDRRFVVRAGSGRDSLDTEYAWPPSELFPEGTTAPGEPEILEPGKVIDRFGTPEGRVFAAVDTTFTQRSLPPSHVNAEYRRYRVLKPLPVWRGISAAWFGQSGGGVRFRTTQSALDLIALGYLTEESDEG
jgi:hypothetical protein